jgi:hypothetical protein
MGKLGIIPIKLVTFGLHKHTSLLLIRRLRILNVFYHRNLINKECSLRVSAGIQAMVSGKIQVAGVLHGKIQGL